MSTSTRHFTWADGAAALTSRAENAPPSGVGDRSWRLLSIKEIASACQLSEKAVRRAIDSGELPAVKLRSRLRVTPQDFEAWIASARRGGGRVTAAAAGRRPRRGSVGTFRALMQSNDGRGAEL